MDPTFEASSGEILPHSLPIEFLPGWARFCGPPWTPAPSSTSESRPFPTSLQFFRPVCPSCSYSGFPAKFGNFRATSAHRGHLAGAKRRVAAAKPLHAGRGHGRSQPPNQRSAASPNSTMGSLTDCHLKHAGIYTMLTDVTLTSGRVWGIYLVP
jgi:hypothetical protein